MPYQPRPTAETVRSELPNLWRSMNQPRACRHLCQICPQTKDRFKRQPYYVRSLTDVSERGRPRDLRLWYRSGALITIKKVWSLARADANIMGENRCDRIVA